MTAKIVTIDLGHHEYDIYIGENFLEKIGNYLTYELDGKSAFIVTDENVQNYAKTISLQLKSEGAKSVEMIVLPAGEKTKSFDQYQKLCEWMLKNGVERGSSVFAVGGGVIGDLTGFVAATVMRGIKYIQVPTTLLAQVDSSVGGKTGINTNQGKNLVGSFYQPEAVIIDLNVLKTLPKRELLAGYAEVVKYGLIGDLPFFKWLEENGEDVLRSEIENLSKAIVTSVEAKASLVRADEREKGQRALLNLGHTFGHALEAVAGYDGRLLHGEGVAIGTVMALDLSYRMGLIDEDTISRVEEHYKKVGLPTRVNHISGGLITSVDELIKIMKRDKKVERDTINFIVVNSIGDAFVSGDVPDNILRDVLSDALGADTQETTTLKGQGPWKSAFSSLFSRS